MLQKPKAWFNSWETNLTIFKQRATRLLLKLHVRFEKKNRLVQLIIVVRKLALL